LLTIFNPSEKERSSEEIHDERIFVLPVSETGDSSW